MDEIMSGIFDNGNNSEACKEKILSNEYYDFIVDYKLPPQRIYTEDYCTIAIGNSGFLAYVRGEDIPPLSIGTYSYSMLPKLYTLVDKQALEQSGILRIQSGTLELTGRGVMIGFVDTGIQYQNELFCYPDGSSRIISIWDQSDQSGKSPERFLYGSVYDQEMINRALLSGRPYDIVPERDDSGHGTAMAELAAGSYLEGAKYAGAAPDADIAVVKLKEAKPYLKDFFAISSKENVYQENDIITGILYLKNLAQQRNQPFVLVLGLGTNMGDHSGQSSLARLLNSIALGVNCSLVVAGGNEGNARHHYQGGGNYSEVEIRVGEREPGFFLELWGEIPEVFSISLRSPSGEEIPRIPARLDKNEQIKFLYDSTTVIVDYRIVERETGKELITLRFDRPSAGIWTIGVFSQNGNGGSYQMWLPISGFISEDTFFLQPNPYITLTEPSNAMNVICTAGYQSQNNSSDVDSGRGYTMDGLIKPDLAAPSVNLLTSGGSFSGTSMGAAITAGACADFLEWAVVRNNIPYVTAIDVKNYMIKGAKRQPGVPYPNRESGYGRLDLKGIFDSLIKLG